MLESMYASKSNSLLFCYPIFHHCIRMGFAGNVWKSVRPKFDNLQNYINALTYLRTNRPNIKEFDISVDMQPEILATLPQNTTTKVLAFIPTGWTNATKSLKKNSIIRQDNLIVQLIPYSEHSQFYELVEFVRFLRPKEIIPTVFEDVGTDISCCGYGV